MPVKKGSKEGNLFPQQTYIYIRFPLHIYQNCLFIVYIIRMWFNNIPVLVSPFLSLVPSPSPSLSPRRCPRPWTCRASRCRSPDVSSPPWSDHAIRHMKNTVSDGVITLNDIICKTCHYSWPGLVANWKSLHVVQPKLRRSIDAAQSLPPPSPTRRRLPTLPGRSIIWNYADPLTSLELLNYYLTLAMSSGRMVKFHC